VIQGKIFTSKVYWAAPGNSASYPSEQTRLTGARYRNFLPSPREENVYSTSKFHRDYRFTVRSAAIYREKCLEILLSAGKVYAQVLIKHNGELKWEPSAHQRLVKNLSGTMASVSQLEKIAAQNAKTIDLPPQIPVETDTKDQSDSCVSPDVTPGSSYYTKQSNPMTFTYDKKTRNVFTTADSKNYWVEQRELTKAEYERVRAKARRSYQGPPHVVRTRVRPGQKLVVTSTFEGKLFIEILARHGNYRSGFIHRHDGSFQVGSREYGGLIAQLTDQVWHDSAFVDLGLDYEA
jgi:hypothetical protein